VTKIASNQQKSKLIRVSLIIHVLFGCVDNSMLIKNPDQKEIIYISSNGLNVDVFNIEELWFSEEGVEYLNRRDFEYGEFGGRMEFCSNKDYYCLGGGLNVTIPKSLSGQKAWQFQERECQANTALSDQQQTDIVCRFKGHTRRFTYSPQQGIVSYFYDRPSGASYEFKLRGDKGLFAPSR
jgi:hypothetical protein